MLHDALFAVWFLLPAGVANVAPILAAHVSGLKRFDAPIDGGALLHGRRLLGNHKTWRGIISGVVLATIVVALQQLSYTSFEWARYVSDSVDYSTLPVLLLGPALALGALGGDALESFFKRRRGIRAGRPWYVFDQIDYIIGAIIVSLLFVRLEFIEYLWMVGVWFAAHLLASYIGWRLKLKDAPI